MNKKDFATLIDAYADAKASKNHHLLNTMVAQLEKALNMLFGEDEVTSENSEY